MSPPPKDLPPTSLPPLRTLFFEDLAVGMTETLQKTVASSDVVGFAQLTGDRNPIHLSEHFAARHPELEDATYNMAVAEFALALVSGPDRAPHWEKAGAASEGVAASVIGVGRERCSFIGRGAAF